ncbi:MAG: hypothetical protein ACREMY_34225 [bacterium]
MEHRIEIGDLIRASHARKQLLSGSQAKCIVGQHAQPAPEVLGQIQSKSDRENDVDQGTGREHGDYVGLHIVTGAAPHFARFECEFVQLPI